MRPLFRPLLLAMTVLLAVGASPAHAGLSSWTGLPGLNAAFGASWVREYATGLPPTTIYAATEGGGVYKSETDGLTWSAFNSGLNEVPGAKNVRTVYTSGTTVYAGTTAGLFKSIAGGAWQPVAQGPEEDPSKPKKLNAPVQALYSITGGPLLAGVASGGVYRSNDGGATWIKPAPGNGMPVAESVWSLGEFVPGIVFAATGSGIYRSLNAGATWTPANDGISGTTLRVFADEKAPNIYYAAGTSGVFRSINAGITWSNITPAGAGQVRALKQLSGVDLTRLYIGSENGVYVGTTDHSLLPGEVKWRKATNTGLGSNVIIWALTSFLTTPGTLLAGTQSNGGYALTFQPAINSALPTISGTLQVGKILTASPGTWSGTETIEYEYQWQRCTSTSTASCSDVTDATAKTFVIPDNGQGARWRVQVTGKNDFPTFGFNEVSSAITGTTAAKAGTYPGDNQSSTASIAVLAPGETSLPQAGDTLRAQNWLFNPAATSTSFQWYRDCTAGGSGCTPIPGATGLDYVLTNAEVTTRLCVRVIGTNASGTTTLGCSGVTNEIFPRHATNVVQIIDGKEVGKPTMEGTAYVGASLVSTVGTWEFPGTTFTRQWEACEPDGGSCATISGAKNADYTVKAADLGKRLRVRINADSNASNKFPPPTEIFTPLSAVVTNPPPPPVVPTPTPTPAPRPGGGGSQQPPSGGGSAPDTAAPVFGSLRAASAKLKPGAQLQLKSALSEPATLTVEVQRLRPGRKVGKACKPSAKKGKKCTAATKVATFKVNAPAGAATLKLPKKELAVGSYRALVTAVDAAGNRGATRTVTFKVVKK